MKKPFSLVAAIIQMVFGFAAIAAFFFLRTAGEDTSRWIITLLLAIAFAFMGVHGLVDYFKKD